MPVIFDQVLARVEPEAAPLSEQPPERSSPIEGRLDDLRHRFGVMIQRAGRLRAD